ncbi:hypothetical protein BWQ96_02184 [Gracilariopsis chorda]|uniref:Uncharacterized protein n=1 Tax=Gracilariopsis chorda TaxID=448386 RepID=A0A2V3J112_9FLOR|nr:hypothetical protein BWQ96_02184 [Gracilariopsis chorda]|eukprot:PXF47993.1 hypothetical protein BWQ96_02184 [Gracilariopsis chorda]
MGIPFHVKPDDDPLLQLCLEIDRLQRLLFGVNAPPLTRKRDVTIIKLNEKNPLDFGKLAAETMRSAVNTKMHCIMGRIGHHLMNHGCIRKGGPDLNETLQKSTKKSYRSPNPRLDIIAPQRLGARAEMMAVEQVAMDDYVPYTPGLLLLICIPF